jgi:hypothetical protein
MRWAAFSFSLLAVASPAPTRNRARTSRRIEDHSDAAHSRLVGQGERAGGQGVWFERSSHMIPREEPGKMLLGLVQSVRLLAEPNENRH